MRTHAADHTAGHGRDSTAAAPLSSTGRDRSRSPIVAGPARRPRTPCRRSNGPSTSATATSRPTSTSPPTASSSPSTTTTSPHVRPAGPDLASCRGARWPPPGSTGASRSPASTSCSTSSRTARINIDCKTDAVVEPLGDVLAAQRRPRPGAASARSATAVCARLRRRLGPASVHERRHRSRSVPSALFGWTPSGPLAAAGAGAPERPADHHRAVRPPVPTSRGSRSTCGRSTTRPRCGGCSTSASTGS